MVIHRAVRRGLPPSLRLLRNDEPDGFICRAATKRSSHVARRALVPRARDNKQGCEIFGRVLLGYFPFKNTSQKRVTYYVTLPMEIRASLAMNSTA